MAVAQILLLLFVVALGCCLCYCVQSHFFQGDDSEIEASPDWLTFFHCIREDCGSSCIINLQKFNTSLCQYGIAYSSCIINLQHILLSILDCIWQTLQLRRRWNLDCRGRQMDEEDICEVVSSPRCRLLCIILFCWPWFISGSLCGQSSVGMFKLRWIYIAFSI